MYNSRFISVTAALYALVLASVSTQAAEAAPRTDLAVVKPVTSCEQLAGLDLRGATSTPAVITAASVLQTPKGAYCKVSGTIAPAITFEVDLPIEHWTQRFVESAMGRGTIGNAGGCAPAINGEIAVAADNLGHTGKGQFDAAWTSDMQARIDLAYRANHETALAAKAVIKAFYGQPQRFAYFLGCSEGGREALQEAQRFPTDFDGVSAGAPVAIDSVHNSFFHAWEAHANQRADGSRILAANRLNILHKAVVTHCAPSAGSIDGMLQIPSACRFDAAWVQCPQGNADTSNCLTAEETAVVVKLYEGPSDGNGHHFEISGLPLGSETAWKLSTATEFGDRETREGFALRRLLPPPEGDEDSASLDSAFAFDQVWYDKVNVLAPLYNAANTDLKAFDRHGGKLILWQGAEDTTVQPATSLAYYEGVRKVSGEATDGFLRYFLLPGVGHCNGGEGPSQIDTLSPLMAWVEGHRAPDVIIAGKTEDHGPMPGPQNPPANQPPGQGNPAAGPPGGPNYPYANADQTPSYTRPIYPFPDVARYTGKGDPNNAVNYERVRSGVSVSQGFDSQAAGLYAPDNQKFYRVENGQLVAEAR